MWEPWTLIAIPIVVFSSVESTTERHRKRERGRERGGQIVLETHPVTKKLERAREMIPTPRYSIHMYKWELRQCHNFPKKNFQMDGGKLLSDLPIPLSLLLSSSPSPSLPLLRCFCLFVLAINLCCFFDWWLIQTLTFAIDSRRRSRAEETAEEFKRQANVLLTIYYIHAYAEECSNCRRHTAIPN